MVKEQEISIEDFDAMCLAEEFVEGPYIESFGDGYGQPYNPKRKIFGTLHDGQKVYAIKQ